MPSSSSGFIPLDYAEASSSRSPQAASVDSDNDDPTANSRDQALLTTDPLYMENDSK